MTAILLADRPQWRAWLSDHAATTEEVWLVIPHRRHRTAEAPGISHREAIELTEVFRALPTRFPSLRLARPRTELGLRSDLFIGGLRELPVTW